MNPEPSGGAAEPEPATGSNPDPAEPSPAEPSPPPEESVGAQAARGVIWMTAQKWVARAGGLLTTTILTRLLAPEDFGMIAIVWTIVTLTYVLSDMGLATYIVQADEVDQTNLSTAFWVSLIVGATMGGLVFLAAPLLADAISTPATTPILRSVAALMLVIAATSVPLALLRRRMAFRILAIQEVSAALVAQVVAIIAAFSGLGVWALVFQLLTAQLITSGFIWVAARWLPTRHFSRSDFATMIRYGIQVVGNGLVSVFRGWTETAIIVAGLGIRDLGYFTIAQRLVQTATDLSGSAVFPVSTVAFAKANSSLGRLRSAHAKATSVAQAVVTPLMVFIAVSSPVLVPFLFGSEWTLSSLVAQPLAVAAALSFGANIDHGLHNGVGHPGRWLLFTVGIYGLSAALMLLAVPGGAVLVAMAYMMTALVETMGRWLVVGRLLGQSWWLTGRPALAVLPAAATSALAGFGAMKLVSGTHGLVALAVTGLIVVATHLVVLRLLTPGLWRDISILIPARIPNRLTRRGSSGA